MNIDPRYLMLSVFKDGKHDTQDSLSNESFARLGNFFARQIGSPEIGLQISDSSFVAMTQKHDGYMVRSPDPEYLYDQKFIASRDQIYMFLLYAWICLHPSVFEKTWDMLKKCWPFYQNKDVQGLELLIIRSRQRGWILRRWLGDLSLVVNSYARCGYLPRWKHDIKPTDRSLFNLPLWTRFVWRFVSPDWDDVGDCKLHIATLACVHFTGPTFLSKYASRFYFRNRPRAEGSMGGRNYTYPGSGPETALHHYFREETGNSPEIAFHWSFIIQHLNRIYL